MLPTPWWLDSFLVSQKQKLFVGHSPAHTLTDSLFMWSLLSGLTYLLFITISTGISYLFKWNCLRKCSKGQKLRSTDLAETWQRSWVWWDISTATLAHFSDFQFWSYREGLIFCPLSTKNPAFQGAFWKCDKTPLVNFAAKWIWPWTLL